MQKPFALKRGDVPLSPIPKALAEGTAEQDTVTTEQTEEIDSPSVANGTPFTAGLLFRRDGEILLAETKDYKGSSWADQQRRFILLYASAYELSLGKPVPGVEHFKAVAEKASVLDKNNFTRYTSETVVKYFLTTSTGLALNQDGKREVERIISEINNPQTTPGHEYWNQSHSDTTNRYWLSDKDKERLHSWTQENVDLGRLDILKIKSGRDYALLAFWLIIDYLKKGDCFRWNEAYEFLKAKYQAISASPETFSKAVKSASNSKYFRESGEAYFLTPEAKTTVENWIAGTSTPGSSEAKTE